MTAVAAWLLENEDLLPRSGRALDVACGDGRHALWLAERGLDVIAVDRDPARLATLRAASHPRVAVEERDLEAPGAPLGARNCELVVVVSYLHRPLFPRLLGALAAGGLLVYETFTREQARLGRPRNPDFLLEPGELLRRVAGLTLLRQREGIFEGRALASIVARREA